MEKHVARSKYTPVTSGTSKDRLGVTMLNGMKKQKVKNKMLRGQAGKAASNMKKNASRAMDI